MGRVVKATVIVTTTAAILPHRERTSEKKTERSQERRTSISQSWKKSIAFNKPGKKGGKKH